MTSILRNGTFNTIGNTQWILSGTEDDPVHALQSPAGWRVEHITTTPNAPQDGRARGWVYVRESPPGLAIDSNNRQTKTFVRQDNVTVPQGTHFINLKMESHLVYGVDIYTVGVSCYLTDEDGTRYGMADGDYVWLPEIHGGNIQKGTHNVSVEWDSAQELNGTFVIEVWVKWGGTRGELRIESVSMTNAAQFVVKHDVVSPKYALPSLEQGGADMPAPLPDREWFRANVDSPPVNVRSVPSVINSAIIARLENGDVIQLEPEDKQPFVSASGYMWRRVRKGTLSGWVANSVLKYTVLDKAPDVDIQALAEELTALKQRVQTLETRGDVGGIWLSDAALTEVTENAQAMTKAVKLLTDAQHANGNALQVMLGLMDNVLAVLGGRETLDKVV